MAAARAPRGLKRDGKALWKAILADVPPGWELDARELHALGQACRCADEARLLEEAIDEHGALVEGSRGQHVANKAFAEVRALRELEAKLLSSIRLEEPETPAQARSRRAARLRQTRLRAVGGGQR